MKRFVAPAVVVLFSITALLFTAFLSVDRVKVGDVEASVIVPSNPNLFGEPEGLAVTADYQTRIAPSPGSRLALTATWDAVPNAGWYEYQSAVFENGETWPIPWSPILRTTIQPEAEKFQAKGWTGGISVITGVKPLRWAFRVRACSPKGCGEWNWQLGIAEQGMCVTPGETGPISQLGNC